MAEGGPAGRDGSGGDGRDGVPGLGIERGEHRETSSSDPNGKATLNFHPAYNSPDDNTILQSSDDVCFRYDLARLAKHSGFFADLLSLPQSEGAEQFCPLPSTSADVLEFVLDFCSYPNPVDLSESPKVLPATFPNGIFEFAHAYDFTVLIVEPERGLAVASLRWRAPAFRNELWFRTMLQKYASIVSAFRLYELFDRAVQPCRNDLYQYRCPAKNCSTMTGSFDGPLLDRLVRGFRSAARAVQPEELTSEHFADAAREVRCSTCRSRLVERRWNSWKGAWRYAYGLDHPTKPAGR